MSRIMEWIDRDNARADEILASRSTRWLVGRTLLGALMMGKGIALGLHATHVWQYALAPILPAESFSRSRASKLFSPASRQGRPSTVK
jgi:hypothetical protein